MQVKKVKPVSFLRMEIFRFELGLFEICGFAIEFHHNLSAQESRVTPNFTLGKGPILRQIKKIFSVRLYVSEVSDSVMT